MTLVNTETGELISEEQVRASIRRVIDHAESIWDEWAWQVENRTWTAVGYQSWDDMRRGEYGALTSIAAPRAERPELVSRFRSAGLTQNQTAVTLGISRETVQRHDVPTYAPRDSKAANDASSSEDIVDAEIVEDDNVVQMRTPVRQAQRDDAEHLLNRVQSLADQAAREAAKLTPAQIARVKPKADLWTVGLGESLETLQRLLTSLNEEK